MAITTGAPKLWTDKNVLHVLISHLSQTLLLFLTVTQEALTAAATAGMARGQHSSAVSQSYRQIMQGHFWMCFDVIFWVIRGTQRRQLMCFVFCSNHTNLERNQLINPVYLRSSPAAAPTCSIPQAQLWYQLPGTGTVCCSMFSLTQHGLSPPRGFQQYK